MQSGENAQFHIDLSKEIYDDAQLPDSIFFRPFKHYLFFDSDISSSDALIFAVQEIVKVCFGFDSKIQIFSCTDRTSLGYLDINENWINRINEIGKVMRDNGDCGGLILVEFSKKWIVYQRFPVEVGVFAFNSNENLQSLSSFIDECFFDSKSIKNWLSLKSKRDVDLVNSLGHDYLTSLIKNYS